MQMPIMSPIHKAFPFHMQNTMIQDHTLLDPSQSKTLTNMQHSTIMEPSKLLYVMWTQGVHLS